MHSELHVEYDIVAHHSGARDGPLPTVPPPRNRNTNRDDLEINLDTRSFHGLKTPAQETVAT